MGKKKTNEISELINIYHETNKWNPHFNVEHIDKFMLKYYKNDRYICKKYCGNDMRGDDWICLHVDLLN